MATCPHCRNEVSAMATRCPFCTGTFPSYIFTQMKGLGQLIILLLIAAVGYVVWLILQWIYELVITILTFIWNVVTWPFRFTWQSFENVIVGSTNLVGINHDPAWWETIILMGVIAAGIGFLWLLKPTDKNWIEEKTKIKFQNIKIGVTALAVFALISCGIFVSPKSNAPAPIATASVAEENSADKNPESSSQDASKDQIDAPINSANIRVVIAPASTANFLTEMLVNNSNQIKLLELKNSVDQSYQKPDKGDIKTSRALNERGLVLIKQGNFLEASNSLGEATKVNPGDIEALNNYAYALLKAAKYDEAEKILGMALSIAPGRTSAWANLGEVYANQNRLDSAAAAFVVGFQFATNKDKALEFLKSTADSDSNQQLKDGVNKAIFQLSKN